MFMKASCVHKCVVQVGIAAAIAKPLDACQLDCLCVALLESANTPRRLMNIEGLHFPNIWLLDVLCFIMVSQEKAMTCSLVASLRTAGKDGHALHIKHVPFCQPEAKPLGPGPFQGRGWLTRATDSMMPISREHLCPAMLSHRRLGVMSLSVLVHHAWRVFKKLHPTKGNWNHSVSRYIHMW